MKRLLLILLFAMPFLAKAQTDSLTRKPTEQYCILTADPKTFSNKVNIKVDFGQPSKLFSDQRMKDETGKVITFNSTVDALNYMNTQGWELVNSYTVTVSRDATFYYVMKRKVEY